MPVDSELLATRYGKCCNVASACRSLGDRRPSLAVTKITHCPKVVIIYTAPLYEQFLTVAPAIIATLSRHSFTRKRGSVLVTREGKGGGVAGVNI